MGGMEELAKASKYWYQNARQRSNSREVMLRRDTALKKPLKKISHTFWRPFYLKDDNTHDTSPHHYYFNSLTNVRKMTRTSNGDVAFKIRLIYTTEKEAAP